MVKYVFSLKCKKGSQSENPVDIITLVQLAQFPEPSGLIRNHKVLQDLHFAQVVFLLIQFVLAVDLFSFHMFRRIFSASISESIF